MPKPDASLYQPNRQAGAAVIFILLRFLRRLFSFLWPILLLWVLNRQRNDSGERGWLGPVVIGLSLFQVVASILAYLRFYFYLEGNELVIEKGILRRSRTNIPLHRIQQVHTNQTLLHRFFDVVELRLDTAGSEKQEVALAALSREKAAQLREAILQQSQAAPAQMAQPEAETEAAPEALAPEVLLFRRSPADLLRIGLTQNHLQTAGILIGSIFGLLNYADDFFGWQDGQWIRELINLAGLQLEQYQFWLLLGLPLLLLASVVISLGRSVLLYYGLELRHSPRGFVSQAGLLEQRTQSASHSKLQYLRWQQNPLQAWLGLRTLRLYQAASEKVTRRKAITLPGCTATDLQRLLELQYPAEALTDFRSHRLSPLLVMRRWLYLGLLPSLLLTAISWFTGGPWAVLFLLLNPLAFLMARRYQRRYRLDLNPQLIRIRAGIFGRKVSYIEWYKLQSISLEQTPYQRRKALANLRLYTAAGTLSIPYLPLETARQLSDYALYRAEADPRPWM